MTSIFKSSSYYTLANILPQAIGFFFLPVYSRYMTPGDFGIVSAMETLTAIFSIIVCLSLNRAAQRFYFDNNDATQRKNMLSTLYISTIALAFLFVIFALLAEPILQLIFVSIDFYPYFLFCILSVALNSLSLIPTIYYQVSEQPKKYVLLHLSRFVLQILLIMFFVVWEAEGAKGQLKAVLLTASLFAPIYIFIAYKNFERHFDLTLLKKAVCFSWPFVPTLLVAWILNLSDRLFIERFLGLAELGVYSMGYKISMAMFVLTSAFTMAYTPIFYKLANSKNQIEAKRKLYQYSTFAAVIFTLIAFFISLFSKELFDLVLDERYSKGYGILRVIIISHLLSAIMSITSVLYLIQAKLTKLNMYIALQAAILNIILNFLLIPPFGMYGAAIATVLSMVLLTIIQYHKSKEGYFVRVPWWNFTCLIFMLLAVIATYHFYLERFPIFSIISKICIASGLLAFSYLKKNHIKSILVAQGELN